MLIVISGSPVFASTLSICFALTLTGLPDVLITACWPMLAVA